jgi:nucleotide-binding universal stress UspA family protein
MTSQASPSVRTRRNAFPKRRRSGLLRPDRVLSPYGGATGAATIDGMNSEFRPPLEPEPAPGPEPVDDISAAGRAGDGSSGVEPLRLSPLLPRRQNPWLVVEVDGSPAAHGALVWALREAARREATVVAVTVLDEPDGHPLAGAGRGQTRAHLAARDQLEARVLRAIAETGVHGRSRTAVLDRAVFDALMAATRGADLVVVGARGKTVLRPAVPRPPARRLARGA